MIDNHIIFDIAKNNSDMTDIDRLVNIYWSLSMTLINNIHGDIVELGCNKGKSSVFLQYIINKFGSIKKLHLFDSFQGLPGPSRYDSYLNKGDLQSTIDDVIAEFDKWNLPHPIIHSGWFSDTLNSSQIDKIAFCYIDCDFYDSVLTSLQFVYSRMDNNGIIIIDDYCDPTINPNAWDGLPGVKLACDEFFYDKLEKPSVLVGNYDLAMAAIRKF